ncbi:thioesterase domain-containing protein [Streptomyces sp. CB03911]|uniref:thioesterase II family protein n=1 Tax=Streptomyces sp. CB03911 TaxID=1804758 RepID=UPI0009A10533|nr:thioesterase domain-containing protein [Streptomyces sp. CB03911]
MSTTDTAHRSWPDGTAATGSAHPAGSSPADTSLWVRHFHRRPDAPVRLVCLPHAGGSASVFRPWATAAGPGLEVLALQYPGRQDRYREQPVEDIAELADRAVPAVRAAVGDRPYGLFGHSMGALLAFELTRRLERTGHGPDLLAVSGRRPPSAVRTGEYAHLVDDAALTAHLRELSGTDPRLLADEEALQMILPAVRADLTAVDRHQAAPGATVDAPVLAITGDSDPWVTPGEAAAWHRRTTSSFDLRVYSGGHFYLENLQEELLALLGGRLAPAGAR